jgi:hypothetical protein
VAAYRRKGGKEMNKGSLMQVILDRIDELTARAEEHQAAARNCAVQIAALHDVIKKIEDEDKKMKKEVISSNIKKNALKTLLPDERDARRVNIFLEFLDKVGELPSSFTQAKERMPKLGTAIYRHKLWNSWPEFKKDYRRWLNREEPWTGILERKVENDKMVGKHEFRMGGDVREGGRD